MTPPPWRPWRSVWLARAVLVAALAAGVPLFLRMPPWCDLTLYDVAARNLLAGGVHYRDVFDTNLPGFVWAAGGRPGGARLEHRGGAGGGPADRGRRGAAARPVAARAGADRAARAWAVAGVALFYLFTSEFNHCQRDVWMLLPALAAVLYGCGVLC